MTICNACRYCEGFCAVFPAMERRLTFAEADLNYLANLCHNCGECLHACQYAPPHEFKVNVPLTLAEIRLQSYQRYCWPQWLATAFRYHGLGTALALSATLSAVMVAGTQLFSSASLFADGHGGDFYTLVSHDVMVGMFSGVSMFVLLALAIELVRYRRTTTPAIRGRGGLAAFANGLRDALSLRYLHGSRTDCPTKEAVHGPWRRWFHHLTFYGFLLCFASTTVAAIYHSMFGWPAPYAYTSLPVVLGTAGGLGLIVGPVGLWALRGRRDPATADPDQAGLDASFILLLLLTSATGLALLILRTTAAMGLLLVVHLGVVLALFLTLPYGKFVHGLYRAAALIQYARESRSDGSHEQSNAA